MGSTLTRNGYQQLVDEDVKWLEAQPRTLEREHVLLIVKDSVRTYYGEGSFLETRHPAERCPQCQGTGVRIAEDDPNRRTYPCVCRRLAPLDAVSRTTWTPLLGERVRITRGPNRSQEGKVVELKESQARLFLDGDENEPPTTERWAAFDALTPCRTWLDKARTSLQHDDLQGAIVYLIHECERLAAPHTPVATFVSEAKPACATCGGSGTVEDDAVGALGYVVRKMCPACLVPPAEDAVPSVTMDLTLRTALMIARNRLDERKVAESDDHEVIAMIDAALGLRSIELAKEEGKDGRGDTWADVGGVRRDVPTDAERPVPRLRNEDGDGDGTLERAPEAGADVERGFRAGWGAAFDAFGADGPATVGDAWAAWTGRMPSLPACPHELGERGPSPYYVHAEGSMSGRCAACFTAQGVRRTSEVPASTETKPQTFLAATVDGVWHTARVLAIEECAKTVANYFGLEGNYVLEPTWEAVGKACAAKVRSLVTPATAGEPSKGVVNPDVTQRWCARQIIASARAAGDVLDFGSGLEAKIMAALDAARRPALTTPSRREFPCCEAVQRVEAVPGDASTLLGGRCAVHGVSFVVPVEYERFHQETTTILTCLRADLRNRDANIRDLRAQVTANAKAFDRAFREKVEREPSADRRTYEDLRDRIANQRKELERKNAEIVAKNQRASDLYTIARRAEQVLQERDKVDSGRKYTLAEEKLWAAFVYAKKEGSWPFPLTRLGGAPLPSTCTWFDDSVEGEPAVACARVATHYACTNVENTNPWNACAEHACRCPQPTPPAKS